MSEKEKRVLFASIIASIALAGAVFCEMNWLIVGTTLITIAFTLMMLAPFFVD